MYKRLHSTQRSRRRLSRIRGMVQACVFLLGVVSMIASGTDSHPHPDRSHRSRVYIPLIPNSLPSPYRVRLPGDILPKRRTSQPRLSPVAEVGVVAEFEVVERRAYHVALLIRKPPGSPSGEPSSV